MSRKIIEGTRDKNEKLTFDVQNADTLELETATQRLLCACVKSQPARQWCDGSWSRKCGLIFVSFVCLHQHLCIISWLARAHTHARTLRFPSHCRIQGDDAFCVFPTVPGVRWWWFKSIKSLHSAWLVISSKSSLSQMLFVSIHQPPCKIMGTSSGLCFLCSSLCVSPSPLEVSSFEAFICRERVITTCD